MFNDYEQEEQAESQGMKQLRQALEKANAALKAKDDELGKLSSAVRSRSVREILRDKGLNPKVASLVPSTVDPTPEAVAAWVDEFKDVLGFAPKEEKATGSEPEPVPAEPARPSLDAGTQDALMRLQNVEAAAGVVPMETEQAQLAALVAAAEAAGNDFGKLKSILSGN